MSMKIIFDQGTTTDEDLDNGLNLSISWDSLMPTINQFVRLRSDEKIIGLTVDEINVTATIGRKKGRKTKPV